MVFLYALAVALAVWSVAAIQLLPAVRDAGRLLAWCAGALALATAACVVYGAYGLARYVWSFNRLFWLSPSREIGARPPAAVCGRCQL